MLPHVSSASRRRRYSHVARGRKRQQHDLCIGRRSPGPSLARGLGLRIERES